MVVKWVLVPTHPLQGVKLPVKVNNVRLRYLTPAEISQLLSHYPPHLKNLVQTALHTGMRKNEIVSLRWEQVNLEQQFVLLTDTKNNETRGIPLNAAMIELLKEIKKEHER
jgi:integrase